MLNLTSWHNWIAFAALLLIVGFLLHQLAARWTPAATVVKASFGA